MLNKAFITILFASLIVGCTLLSSEEGILVLSFSADDMLQVKTIEPVVVFFFFFRFQRKKRRRRRSAKAVRFGTEGQNFVFPMVYPPKGPHPITILIGHLTFLFFGNRTIFRCDITFV